MIADLLAKRMYWVVWSVRVGANGISRWYGKGCVHFGGKSAHCQDLGS